MNQERSRYFSYLVRLWRVRERRGWGWRGSLECPSSGERHAFPDFESLIAFLREQTSHQGWDEQEIGPDSLLEHE